MTIFTKLVSLERGKKNDCELLFFLREANVLERLKLIDANEHI